VSKSEPLVVDELGFMPFECTVGDLLFNLLVYCYERRSTFPHS
jgi:DNA replication protein DnaC